MRFLLNIRVQLPGEWTSEQRADLVRRETEAAVDLILDHGGLPTGEGWL